MPSVRFTALVTARIVSAASRHHPIGPRSKPGESHRVKERVVCWSVKLSSRIGNPNATTSRPTLLARLLSPRLRSLRILIQSSRKPTSPAPKMASMVKMPV